MRAIVDRGSAGTPWQWWFARVAVLSEKYTAEIADEIVRRTRRVDRLEIMGQVETYILASLDEGNVFQWPSPEWFDGKSRSILPGIGSKNTRSNPFGERKSPGKGGRRPLRIHAECPVGSW